MGSWISLFRLGRNRSEKQRRFGVVSHVDYWIFFIVLFAGGVSFVGLRIGDGVLVIVLG